MNFKSIFDVLSFQGVTAWPTIVGAIAGFLLGCLSIKRALRTVG